MDIFAWVLISGLAIIAIGAGTYWKQLVNAAEAEKQHLLERMERLEALARADAEQLVSLRTAAMMQKDRITELADDFMVADTTIEVIRQILVDNKLTNRAHFRDIYAHIEAYRAKDE